MTRAEARRVVRSLRDSAESLRDRPGRKIVEVLGAVGERFLDPGDSLRQEAEAAIPEEAGLSPEMAGRVVEGMARDWTRDRLHALVRADFPDPDVLDGFRAGAQGTRVRALGPRLALHVGAGSVPGVTATSLVRSLLVKTPALVKPGAGDRALPRLFARGIREADAALARSVAVEYWPGEAGGPLEDEAVAAAGLVVVYGGTATVRAWRERLPPTTPLVAYHHRVSVGVVARESLGASAARLAREAALAVATFDQRGCVSPHVIWVEEGGAVGPGEWAALLARELDGLDRSLPPGPLEPDVAAGIQQLRGAAELRAAAGGGDRVHGGPPRGWTVLYEEDPAFEPSCLGRTVRVKPIPRLEAVAALLAPLGEVLQSVALEAEGARRAALAEALARAGAARITSFRAQPWPPAWWRHDGKGPLEVLVRWTSMDG